MYLYRNLSRDLSDVSSCCNGFVNLHLGIPFHVNAYVPERVRCMCRATVFSASAWALLVRHLKFACAVCMIPIRPNFNGSAPCRRLNGHKGTRLALAHCMKSLFDEVGCWGGTSGEVAFVCVGSGGRVGTRMVVLQAMGTGRQSAWRWFK